MTAFHSWLAAQAGTRRRAGLTRVLRPRRANDDVLDLAGNDYLGLAHDSRVVTAAAEAAFRWGAGSTGSRLVTGTTELHVALERELAQFTSAEAALVFSSGYAANLGVLQALSGVDTLVVSDRGNHASIVDGCRLARATVAVAPHADPAAVDRLLAARDLPRAIVVTDAVFSVDGDIAPLAALHEVCRRRDALLVIDEAHALGVVGVAGAGAAVDVRIAAEPDVVRTVTLSKALGSQGGAVLGSAAVIEQLTNAARTFIFDTALGPPSVGAALAALRILAADAALPAAARRRTRDIAVGVGAPPPEAAVVSVVLGDPGAAVAAADRCLAAGVRVGCFRPPSVPAGTSRLRVTGRADLSDDEVARAVAVIVDAVKDSS